ncbi:MAG: hypothetical protein AB3N17_07580, partial [Tateyamaria sp.]
IVKPQRLRHSLVMRAVFSLSLVCLLAGCLPLSTFYAEGVSFAQLDRDNTNCDVRALRDAPVANQVRQGPPRYVSRRYCDAEGKCYTRGGFWVPGDIYTVDVNAGLRQRVKAQCMGDLGYRAVEIPACSAAVQRAAPPGQTTILPRLSENTCVIRNDNGSIQIVRTQ